MATKGTHGVAHLNLPLSTQKKKTKKKMGIKEMEKKKEKQKKEKQKKEEKKSMILTVFATAKPHGAPPPPPNSCMCACARPFTDTTTKRYSYSCCNDKKGYNIYSCCCLHFKNRPSYPTTSSMWRT